MSPRLPCLALLAFACGCGTTAGSGGDDGASPDLSRPVDLGSAAEDRPLERLDLLLPADDLATADLATAADLAGPGDLAAASDLASAPDLAQKLPGVYGGHCDAPFPSLTKEAWKHNIATPLTVAQGAPGHRVRDLVLAPGEAGKKLRGRFTYGLLDKDLADEKIELWVQTCPSWERWGTLYTDQDGIVLFDVPNNLPPGDYKLRLVVRGDLTTADGMIAVWRRGMRVIVTDIDGTLTTSDWELWKDVIFGPDAAMYADADKVIQGWAKKDYRIVYLTGRPQIVNRYTRRWLATRAFPFSPLFLADDGQDLPPTANGVQKFKADLLKEHTQRVGMSWVAAYGNATTDIGAYELVPIPKADTYIIGPNAGMGGTVAVKSYTAHLPTLVKYPVAIQP